MPNTPNTVTYPAVRRGPIVETHHNIEVADPYRWLEDPDSAETEAFVAAQSKLTNDHLASMDGRDAIRTRITSMMNFERRTGLTEKGGSYFFWRNDGLQNQPTLWRQTALDGEPELVLDPNEMSEDGTTAVVGVSLTDDAALMTYTVTRGGGDWQEIYVRDLTTLRDLDDEIRFARFPQVAWHPDKSGFFYNGHLPPDEGISAENNKHNKLFWHRLGTAQSTDEIIYERPDQPEWNFPTSLTEDDRYLMSRVWHGAINRNRIFYRPLAESGPLRPLIADADAEYNIIGTVGSTAYVSTNNHASNKRIIAIDINSPQRENWREAVAEQADALTFATIADGKFVLGYLHDAHTILKVHALTGEWLHDIELPTVGTVSSLSAKQASADLFIGFSSFLFPESLFHYNLQSKEMRVWNRPKLVFDTDTYETVLKFASSKDGTQVPLFITHRKGINLDGSHPAILYGYGGFSVNLGPRFSVSRLQWLEMGGIFVQAALRGGSEYGESWHRGGMLEQKQNVFDDFISSAEMLIAGGYTNSGALAIQGGSNGGLLVAACMLQQPDLFGAVLCHVPVIDMLRYHVFTAGRYWVPEYGDPDNPDHFAFLHAYSPLHNVRGGVDYPAALILTADRDDRVVPMHAHKFAATLQHEVPDGNPFLLRFELKAGHGFGKSTSKLIDEAADVHAFLSHHLAASVQLPDAT